jgi:hypothetical protein
MSNKNSSTSYFKDFEILQYCYLQLADVNVRCSQFPWITLNDWRKGIYTEWGGQVIILPRSSVPSSFRSIPLFQIFDRIRFFA